MKESLTWLVVTAIFVCLLILVNMLRMEGFQDPTLSSDGKAILNLLEQKAATGVSRAPLVPLAAISTPAPLVPLGATTTPAPLAKSTPSSTNLLPTSSPAELQGQALKAMVATATPEQKIVVVPVPSNNLVPIPPQNNSCPQNLCRCSRKCQECPRKPASCRPPKWEPGMPVPDYCPSMPDMSDYIRKDSIPCWACKL